MIRCALGTVLIVLALVGAAPVLGAAAFNANGLPVAAVENVKFSGAVATFSDPTAPSPKYTATIDWGDNTPATAGTLVKTGSENSYEVDGQHNYTEEGSYHMHVVITGGTGGSTSPTATVADAPLSATVSVPQRAESSVLDGVVATFVDPDPYDSPSEYTATINWGDGTNSTGAIVKTVNGPVTSTFTVGGNHAWAEEGAFTVSVTVKAAGALGSTVTATHAVTVVDAALTAGPAVTRRGVEGRSLTAGALATFQDANTGAAATDFTAKINWPDGTTGAGTIAPAAGGGWQVSAGAHTLREEGTGDGTVVVADKGGASVIDHFRLVVADAPLKAAGKRFAAHAGKRFQGAVAAFTDAAGGSAHASDFHATINWGDGHSSAGAVSGSRGRFVVTGAHSYATAGRKNLTVTIHDRGGAAAGARTHATVT
jgi:hypothetical protein